MARLSAAFPHGHRNTLRRRRAANGIITPSPSNITNDPGELGAACAREGSIAVKFNRRSLLQAAFVSAIAPACAAAPSEGHEVVPWPAGAPLPPLQGIDLAGRPWRLADLRGRAVLLNFWATWCEPCRAEMPSLQQLARRSPPGALAVVAMNFKQSVAAVRNFTRSTGLALPVVLDADGAAARALDVHVFPTTLLITADGTPLCRVRGEMDWTGREAGGLISQLLAHPVRASTQST